MSDPSLTARRYLGRGSLFPRAADLTPARADERRCGAADLLARPLPVAGRRVAVVVVQRLAVVRRLLAAVGARGSAGEVGPHRRVADLNRGVAGYRRKLREAVARAGGVEHVDGPS